MKDNDFYDEEEQSFWFQEACKEPYETRVIRMILKEAAEEPFLTQEEEISFAQQIEAGKKEIVGILAENVGWKDITSQLQEYVGQHVKKAKKNAREAIGALDDLWKGRGKEEEILKIPLNLLERIAEKENVRRAIFLCQTTRGIINEMIKRNALLVVSIAKKWQRSFLDFDDLLQEGNMGLMKAIEKFNWRKGFKFCTVAIWWIDQAIRRAIENESRVVRIPTYMQSPGKRELLPTTISFEAPVWDSGEKLFLKDTIADERISVEEEAENNIRREKVSAVLSQLPSRHQLVIKLRFGLGTNLPPLTLQMISQIVGKSKERVRQIQEEAFQKLQRPKTSQLLRELL